MSSILTNSSAMVALETLRGINKGMNQVQSEISTGKKVANAKDNAAVYAISTVMSSDVASFDKISESLSLGSATVGVARAGSEQIVDILTEMKTLIVSAQEDNVDRSKIETDVVALKKRIGTIVDAAQFNGQNLLKEGGSIDVLASLNRDSGGSVTASNINVNRSSLETTAQVLGSGSAVAAGVSSGAAGITTGSSQTISFTAGDVAAGSTWSFAVGGQAVDYVSRKGDTMNDVVSNIKTIIDSKGIDGISVTTSDVADPTSTASTFTVSNSTDATITFTNTATGVAGGTAGGGLGTLGALTVATEAGATSALSSIEGLLSVAVDAAASFGSAQKSIDTQDDFVNSLMDAMKVGVGALVDADMEEASARLQSLQVQQQLGTQALSIANQAPQSLLSLFR